MSGSWSDRAPSIVRILRTDVGALLAPLQPNLIYVYGSIVTGLAQPDSDADFGIEFDDPDGAFRHRSQQWARQTLRQAFGSSRIDVGDLGRTDSSHYLVHVVTKGVCLYARSPEIQVAFEERVLRQAGEHVAVRAETWQAIKARFREELAAETGLIERDKLEKLLWQSLELLRFLMPYRQMSPERFFDPEAFEHRFSVAHVMRSVIECQMTMARHLMLAMGWSRAFRPEDMLRVMVDQGVLPRSAAEEWRLVQTLRDPLTYPGEPVDWELVHEALMHRLGTFIQFNRHFVGYLERLGV